MIVDCPHCHASNSEIDTGPDGIVLCRHCQRRFKAGEQAQKMSGNTTQVARKTLEEQDDDPRQGVDPDAAGSAPEFTQPAVRAPEPTMPAVRVSGTATHNAADANDADTDGPTRIGVAPVGDLNAVEEPGEEGPTRIGPAPSEPAINEERTAVGVQAPGEGSIERTAIGLPPTVEVNLHNAQSHEERPSDGTNVMSREDLLRSLIDLESAGMERGDTVSGVRIPTTPVRDTIEPVQTPNARPWAKELRRRGFAAYELFMAQPKQVRITASIAAGLLFVLIVLSIRLAAHSSSTTAYASEPQPLLSAPVDGARPNVAGGLLRGEEVTVFDSVGDFVMVRDLQGRVGYVQESGLMQERPGSTPESPFVDCKPGTAEQDMEGCKARAETQWESCLAVCEKHDQLSKCNDDCRGLYRVCFAACHGEAVHPEPGYSGSGAPSDAQDDGAPHSDSAVGHKYSPRPAHHATDKKRRH